MSMKQTLIGLGLVAASGAAHASTASSPTMTAHWRSSVEAEPTAYSPTL